MTWSSSGILRRLWCQRMRGVTMPLILKSADCSITKPPTKTCIFVVEMLSSSMIRDSKSGAFSSPKSSANGKARKTISWNKLVNTWFLGLGDASILGKAVAHQRLGPQEALMLTTRDFGRKSESFQGSSLPWKCPSEAKNCVMWTGIWKASTVWGSFLKLEKLFLGTFGSE